MSKPSPGPQPTTSAGFEGGWSVPATSRRVYEVMESLDWSRGRTLDVGCGTGMFVRSLAEKARGLGVDPAEHVFACDTDPSSFEAPGLRCDPAGTDGTLPYADDAFDIVLSIEVVEHVDDQFAFVRELVRVARPGGTVIVTTPNTLNINSRLRTLMWGFPLLYDPLPHHDADPRLLDGHVHPISPYFLAYNAIREGLVDVRLLSDRTKKSAVALTLLCSPLLLLGKLFQGGRLRRKRPEVARMNEELVRAVTGWELLTGRTTVLVGTKPERPAD